MQYKFVMEQLIDTKVSKNLGRVLHPICHGRVAQLKLESQQDLDFICLYET